MRVKEIPAQCLERLAVRIERGFRMAVTHLDDALHATRWCTECATSLFDEIAEPCLRLSPAVLIERQIDADSAHRLRFGDTDAISRQHAGERMDEHGVETRGGSHSTGVLSRRATERHQCEACGVDALTDADVADGIGHRLNGDVQKACRQ